MHSFQHRYYEQLQFVGKSREDESSVVYFLLFWINELLSFHYVFFCCCLKSTLKRSLLNPLWLIFAIRMPLARHSQMLMWYSIVRPSSIFNFHLTSMNLSASMWTVSAISERASYLFIAIVADVCQSTLTFNITIMRSRCGAAAEKKIEREKKREEKVAIKKVLQKTLGWY